MDREYVEKRIAELDAEVRRLEARANQLIGAAAAYREVLARMEPPVVGELKLAPDTPEVDA